LLQNLQTDSGKQQVHLRQQTTIESLELDNRALTTEIDTLRLERRRLLQSEGALTDTLYLLQSQLDNARASYERDVLAMRPFVEKQV